MPYGSFSISVPQCDPKDVFFDKNDHMRQPLEALTVAASCQLFDEIMKELDSETVSSNCERKKEEIKRAVEHLAETVNKQPEDVLRGLVVLYATTTTLDIDQRLTDLAVADIAWLRTLVKTKGAYLPPPCINRKDLRFLTQLIHEL